MARCKVCHRTMTNPAHIAAGMGPVCAQKMAARASVRDAAATKRAARIREGAERVARECSRVDVQDWLTRRDEIGWDADEVAALELALLLARVREIEHGGKWIAA